MRPKVFFFLLFSSSGSSRATGIFLGGWTTGGTEGSIFKCTLLGNLTSLVTETVLIFTQHRVSRESTLISTSFSCFWTSLTWCWCMCELKIQKFEHFQIQTGITAKKWYEIAFHNKVHKIQFSFLVLSQKKYTAHWIYGFRCKPSFQWLVDLP